MPLGVSSRFGWRKAAPGAGEGISVLGARLPVAVSSLRSTDAQARTQSCRSPLLGGVADHRHLAGGRDLGVREHLFCFARQIAIWRHVFESWRERGGDAIGWHRQGFFVLFTVWYLEGFRVFDGKRNSPLLSLNV